MTEIENWFLSRARVSSKPHPAIKLDDKIAFFHQLATLLGAGTPLLQAIRISGQQSESLKLRAVLDDIASRIAAGTPFHVAAGSYPRVFEFAWVEVIRTGEVTGKMAHVLKELNKQVQDTRTTRRKVQGALTYPIILLCVATLALTAMLWFVVPTFTKMFNEMGAKLPAMTQFVVSASKFVTDNGLYILAGLGVAVFLFRRYWQTDSGRRRILSLLIAAPTVGDLIVQAAMYQFTSCISLLLNSGVPMMETLSTMKGIFGRNPIYREALGRAQGRVAAGQPLAASLEETGLFTSMIINMVRVGEESGQLGPVMEQIAPYYKERMEAMITKTSKIMEPFIIVGMGAAVAVMMLSIYMPMFEMSGNIK